MDMKNKKNLKNFKKKVCAVSSHITAKSYTIYVRTKYKLRRW